MKSFLTCLLALVLTACGGGGSSTTDPGTTTKPVTGTPFPGIPGDGVGPTPYNTDPASLGKACETWSVPQFQLKSAKAIAGTAPAMNKPARGIGYADPAFGTCSVRVTDHAADGLVGFARNDYSRRQAFNADNSLLLVGSLNGFWHVYNTRTYTFVKTLASLAGDAEPQWHPTDPDLLYFVPTNGLGMALYQLKVSTNTPTKVADWSARLKARWPGANAAWTKSEGSPSANGRYWCLMVDDASWTSVGVITWDRDTDTILGYYETNGERPDHVSMSPSGDYCVVSGDGPRGTIALTRDLTSSKQLLPKSEHSDLARLANGDDAYVSVDYASNGGDVFFINLRTGERTLLWQSYVSGSATAFHFSGKAFNKPGWVLVSSYADYGGLQWFHRRVMAVQLQANPAVLGIAHHRSTVASYFGEPHASVSRDFSHVVFNSDWGAGNTDIDVYMIAMQPAILEASVLLLQ